MSDSQIEEGRKADAARTPTAGLRVPFGKSASSDIVAASQVPRGLACNCTCPGCGGALVANKGERKVWHFSHQANAECANGYESAIHAAMKQLLMREKRIMLPALTVLAYSPSAIRVREQYARTFGNLELASGRHSLERYSVDHVGHAASKAREVVFDQVIEEMREGDIQPDIIGIKGNRRLYIEVAATHLVDQDKELKVRERGVAMVEIRLPYERGVIPSFEMLERLLLNDVSAAEKYWISNPVLEDQAEQSLKARSDAYRARQAQEERIRLAKRARYETHYKPTHRLQMHSPNRLPRVTAELDLCPSYISVRVFSREMYGHTNEFDFEAIIDVARAYSGTFDKSGPKRFWRWKIQPASVELFVRIAQAIRARGLTYVVAPPHSFLPDDEVESILSQLTSQAGD